MGITTGGLSNTMYQPGSRERPAEVPRGHDEVSWLVATEVLLDVATVFSCIEMGILLLTHHSVGARSTLAIHSQIVSLVLAWVIVVLLDRGGAYRTSGGLLHLRETATVLESVFLAAVIIIPCLPFLQPPHWTRFALLELPVVALALVLQKLLVHKVFETVRRRGLSRHRVLIYGAGDSARMLYSALARSPKLGFSPIALIEDECDGCPDEVRKCNSVAPILNVDFDSSVILRHQADMVLISTPFLSREKLQHILSECAGVGAQVVYGADVCVPDSTELDLIELDGQLVYGEHQFRTQWVYETLSRCMDFVVGSMMLLCATVPLMLAAVAIRLESPGPIFFRQVRVGLNGVPFTIFKFRTMFVGACGDSVSPTDSVDPRITWVGRWLRRTSIDELPQLINVLRGEMALVGPRPEMQFIVADYSERQRQRLSVKPGLTGIWQISADRRYPIHENLHYDLYYLKHRSMAMDVSVMFHTLVFAVNGC